VRRRPRFCLLLGAAGVALLASLPVLLFPESVIVLVKNGLAGH
jgi:hypothetical protein